MKRTLPNLLLLVLFGLATMNSGHAQEGHLHDAGADAGMQHRGDTQGMDGSNAASAHAELPKVESEVRRINTRANTVSLRHAEIPNLDMPPMTMVFQVADPSLLEGLAVGDEVLVTFGQIAGAYTVLSVEPMQ
ncbi:MAG: copper-binding protein [Thioalkalivibrio sp.]|nr:copper-binding protein [Thioalkalivibrio sp.]